MRKLVTIRKVDNLLPIPKADFIELAVIGGWSCIVKKGEFKQGDEGLFFEIDSWIPATDTRFEFLGKTKEYKGREGWRIRTMKMRKVLSQGLLLPIDSFPEIDRSNECHAASIGVEKWENQLSARDQQKQSSGKSPKFPSFIPKTDQERLQNLAHYFELHKDTAFEETMKLDGSSITMYKIAEELPWYKKLVNKIIPGTFDGVKFGVCSRNLELKPSDNFAKEFKNGDKISVHDQSDFWKTAIKYGMHKKIPVGYAVQAELIGPKIQSNHEKVNELQLHVYDIYDINREKYCTPEKRHNMMLTDLIGVPHVPTLGMSTKIFQECTDFDQFQERVTGESINPGTVSEGRVYKAVDGSFSFKLISNQYLLKEK